MTRDPACFDDLIVIETPEPAFVSTTLDTLDLPTGPQLRSGKTMRLLAVIETPFGVRILT